MSTTKRPSPIRSRISSTEPLPPSVIAGLHHGVDKLADVNTYTGYGDEQGNLALRQALVKRYRGYGVQLDPDEVFISDGAKPDSANILSIFGADNVVAVQDPAYPVYVDSNVIAGRTGQGHNGHYDGLVYMKCTEANGFFPAVPADPELTEQVLTNLVDNAIKYSPDGGIITIAGKASGEEVEVAVTDPGIGIPPQEVEHVFERFHRADVSAVHRVPGLGLGLYICKTIVEAHGGAIDLSSTPGEGSCVTFTLPRQGSTEEVDTEGSFE